MFDYTWFDEEKKRKKDDVDEDANGTENNAEMDESTDKLGELHNIETKTTEVRKSEMNTLYETEEEGN